MICFTVPGAPKGKGRPRFMKVVGKDITYTPPDTVVYENLVKLAALKATQRKEPLMGACEISISAFFPIPTSWPEAKKSQARLGRLWPAKKPDADNVLKIICDALNGIAWKDDAQVVRASVTKCYDDEPRVEVNVIECEK